MSFASNFVKTRQRVRWFWGTDFRCYRWSSIFNHWSFWRWTNLLPHRPHWNLNITDNTVLSRLVVAVFAVGWTEQQLIKILLAFLVPTHSNVLFVILRSNIQISDYRKVDRLTSSANFDIQGLWPTSITGVFRGTLSTESEKRTGFVSCSRRPYLMSSALR